MYIQEPITVCTILKNLKIDIKNLVSRFCVFFIDNIVGHTALNYLHVSNTEMFTEMPEV